MTPPQAAMLAAVVLTASAQLLLKRGARPDRRLLAALISPWSVAGYALLLAVTILNVYALTAVPLRTLTAWSAASYPLVLLASGRLLGERIDRRAALATLMVVAGIVVCSL
jgi:drug/metabolite transporter (DMT)-like permease